MNFNGDHYHRSAKFQRDYEQEHGETVIKAMKRQDAGRPDDGIPDFEDHHHAFIYDCLIGEPVLSHANRSEDVLDTLP